MIDAINKQTLLQCSRYELVPALPKNRTPEDYGVLGLLNYRINFDSDKEGYHHPDCLYTGWDKQNNKWLGRSFLADIFEGIYNQKTGYSNSTEDNANRIVSSDTIFNCWIYIKFYTAAVMNIDIWDTVENYVKENYRKIFINTDHLKAFDILADYHHCIANFMPCPSGYNGYSYNDNDGVEHHHDGKGNYKKDWDYPDIYFNRSEKDFPKFHKWIIDNKRKYLLEFFDEYKTNFDPFNIHTLTTDRIITSVTNAINSIEKRANRISKGL